jgi:hypothetical protein
VHIWNEKEILDLPNYGIWFYGLVDEKGEIVLSEIYPGVGYCDFKLLLEDDGKPIDPKDQFLEVGSDIYYRTPEQLKEEYPGAEKVDLDLDYELEHSVPFPEFVDDRSSFLKLMDARYVIDWFLDNSEYAYYPDEIETCAENPELYDNIDLLCDYGIIREKTVGCYELDKNNDITKLLISLDKGVSEHEFPF